MLIRLPLTSANTALPILQLWDWAPIRARLLQLPTLRAFYDFCDFSTLTIADSTRIAAVADLSPNARHLAAAADDRPTWNPTAYGFMGGASFYDNRMIAASGWTGVGLRYSVAGAQLASGADSTSRILVANTADNSANYYAALVSGSGWLRTFSADVDRNTGAGFTTEVQPWIMTADRRVSPGPISIRDFKGGVSAGTTTRLGPSGGIVVGGWSDSAAATNRFRGLIGHVAIFDEDLAMNPSVRELLAEYSRRRYRRAVSHG